jgi:hypothetical protein
VYLVRRKDMSVEDRDEGGTNKATSDGLENGLHLGILDEELEASEMARQILFAPFGALAKGVAMAAEELLRCLSCCEMIG